MKKICLILSAIVLASCSSENEDITVPLDLTDKLKSVITTEETRVYHYNDYGFVTDIITNKEGNPNTKYTYEGNKIVSTTVTNGIVSESEYFTYSDDLIIQSEFFDGEYKHINDYFYDSSGVLIKTIRYIKEGSNPRIERFTEEYIYENENVVTTTFNESGDVLVFKYEYDNKKNPYYAPFPSDFNKIYKVSNNNLTKITFYSGIHIVLYEYNEFDYPVN